MEDGADGRGNMTYTHVSQPHVEHEAIISHSLLSLSVCTCPWYEQMMLPSQRQAAFFCVFPVTHQCWPFWQPPPTPDSPVEPWPFTTLLSTSHSSHTAQERPPSLTASAHWPPACSLGPQTPPLWGLSWPSHQIHPFCGLLQQFPPFSRYWETRYSQEMPWRENEQTLSFWFYFLELGNDIVSSPILPFPDNQAENR